MNVLNRINELRSGKGWTNWRLSEESGVDQSTISAWFSKGRSPSVASLERICYAFGITMSQFFLEVGGAVDITDEQRELLESYTKLTAKQKESVLNLIKNISEEN